MRALVQRCSRAAVRVDGATVGEIAAGVLVLLGVTHADGDDQAQALARKVAGLRIFADSDGKMNLAVGDVGGAALVVSQFTLYADTRKGRRPAFTDAAPPEQAEQLYQVFVEALRTEGVPVEQGQFQAHMHVELVNDGPVTILLET